MSVMTESLLVTALDRDCAGHLAIALRRHIDALKKTGRVVPPGIAQLAETALEIVNKQQEASASISRRDPPEDGLRDKEYLSRTDVAQLAGTSTATVDRWIRSKRLPSTKHGRTRRIARADLDAFLSPA
jgi:excisionase family DNA binding protein